MASKTFQRNTRQRQVILEELLKLTSHPTAVELYEIARLRLPRISLGTVYRNLELLAQMGAIRKLDFGGGEARFDGDAHQHYHVRCVRCGRVDDAHGSPPNQVKDDPKDLAGYKVLGFRLEFIGLCPDCNTPSAADDSAVAPEAGD